MYRIFSRCKFNLMKFLLKPIDIDPSVFRRGRLSNKIFVTRLIRPHNEQQQLFSFYANMVVEESLSMYFFNFWSLLKAYSSISLIFYTGLCLRLPKLTFYPCTFCLLRIYQICSSISYNLTQLIIVYNNKLIIMNQSSSNQHDHSSIILLPDIDRYKETHEPLLSSFKKLAIEQKLKLEKQANRTAKQRQKNYSFFLNYDYNPFIPYKMKDIQALIKIKKDKQESKFSHIVQKLSEQHNGQQKFSEAIRQSIKQKTSEFDMMKKRTAQFSQKNINKIDKAKTIGNKKEQKQKLQKIKPTTYQIPFSHLQIEQIALEREQNFFLKMDEDCNIFNIARGEDAEISSMDKLQKMHFSFNSVHEKINKLKIPTYRDISLLGRKSLQGISVPKQNIIDYIDSSELSFKMNDLLFYDLMSIASGRFSVDFLSRMLNSDDAAFVNKQSSDISSEEAEEMIVYKANQQQKKTGFFAENQEMQQIHDYERLQYNTQESKYLKKCLRKEEKINDQLKLQKSIIENTIDDKNIHQNIEKKVKDQIQDFFETQKTHGDIDRLVRANKLAKNKQGSIKMQSMLRALVTKNKHHSLLQQTNRSFEDLI